MMLSKQTSAALVSALQKNVTICNHPATPSRPSSVSKRNISPLGRQAMGAPLFFGPMDMQMWSGQLAWVTATLPSFTSTVLVPPLAPVSSKIWSLPRSSTRKREPRCPPDRRDGSRGGLGGGGGGLLQVLHVGHVLLALIVQPQQGAVRFERPHHRRAHGVDDGPVQALIQGHGKECRG